MPEVSERSLLEYLAGVYAFVDSFIDGLPAGGRDHRHQRGLMPIFPDVPSLVTPPMLCQAREFPGIFFDGSIFGRVSKYPGSDELLIPGGAINML